MNKGRDWLGNKYKKFPRRNKRIRNAVKETFESAAKTVRSEMRAPVAELEERFNEGARMVHRELPTYVAGLMAYHAHKHVNKGVHGLLTWANKKASEQITAMTPLPNTASRRKRKWFPVKWEPISLLRRGEEENEKLGIVGMEHYCAQSIQRNAVNTAALIPERTVLNEGMPNKYLRAAKELYGTTVVPIYVTSKTGEADLAYSTGGFNAQLVYAPFGYKQNNTSTDRVPFTNGDATAQFENCGIFNEAMIYNFIIDCGMKEWLSTFVPTSDPLKSVASASDVFLPIEGTYTKKCIRNYNKLNDVDVTCYVLEQIRHGNTWPIEDWFDWSDEKTSDVMHAPAGNEDYNPTDIDRSNAYFHPARTQRIQEMVWTSEDNTARGEGRTFCTESSCVPGMTPQMSPQFNMNWKVIDVKKKRLGPDDIWELEFERKFKKSMSWRNLCSKFGGTTNVVAFSHGTVGDYQLLFVARGVPGTYLVPDGNSSDNKILHPEQVKGAHQVESTSSVVVAAECLQCAIEISTTHYIKHHFPTNEYYIKTEGNTRNTDSVPSFIAQKYVKRLTGFRYTPFGLSGFAPVQTTQQEQQVGGLK